LTDITEEVLATADYPTILDECKAVMVERGYNARLEIIASRWEVGQVIAELGSRYQPGQGELYRRLSSDLGMGTRELHYSVQFYEKFPAEEFCMIEQNLPDQKATSWHKVKTQLLPESTQTSEKPAINLGGLISYSKNKIGSDWRYDDHCALLEYLGRAVVVEEAS
jgi:hypothetical protein